MLLYGSSIHKVLPGRVLGDAHVVVEVDLLHGARGRQASIPGQQLPDGADGDLDVPDPLPA